MTQTSATNTNVHAHEIAKFEALASRWWDPSSEFKPLHDINPLRLGYIDEYAKLAGKKILDVGCGGGILAESMVVLGADVTGIDLGEAPLKVAKLHSMESGVPVSYQQISAEELAGRQAGTYDAVTCMEMLEHVPDPASTIAACGQLVKPGGTVFFSTINRNPKSYFFAIVGAEYILNMLPKGTHDYKNFIRPAELEAWCRAANIKIMNLTGMSYNPITKAYALSNNLDVNYLAYGIKQDD